MSNSETKANEGTEKTGKSKRARLTTKHDKLKGELDKRKNTNHLVNVGGVATLAGSIVLAVFSRETFEQMWFVIIYGVAALFFPVINSTTGIKIEIRDVEQEFDLLDSYEGAEGKKVEEFRAEELFESHQIQLEKYYHQTLSQSKLIFFTGIGCILLGTVIIIATGYILLQVIPNRETAQTIEWYEKVLIGTIGAIGSILMNYIATVYLKMHKGTVDSLNQFHSRLVFTHHLHYANYLDSKISDQSLRDRTLSDIVGNISKGAAPAQSSK